MEKLFISETKQKIYNCYEEKYIKNQLVIDHKTLVQNPDAYKGVQCIFSTWGMPCLTKEEIQTYFPKLQCVFYGAGSVKHFAKPFFELGIRIFSAWAANAIPVAEFTVAQIILANKGFYQLHRRYKAGGRDVAVAYAQGFPSNYNTKVGIIGLGMISRHVIKLLRPYKLKLIVYSDYLSDEEAEALGVTKGSLEEIFKSCQTISNHLSNKPSTVGLLNYELFSSMKKNATFINTGRGAQVDESAMIRAMKEEPERMAVLDVTDPKEPMPLTDPIWDVENIILTPHRAGSMTKEIYRMGQFMIDEYDRVMSGKEPLYEITLEMMKTLA